MNSKDGRPTKKPYCSPVLHVYGNIKTITQSTGGKGKIADGGKGIFNKTS